VLAWLVLLAATPCALAAAARNVTDDGDDSAAANARLARDTAANAAPGGYINERAFLARSLAAVADRGSSSASSSSDGSHSGADDPDAATLADDDAATAARQQKEADDVHVIEDVLLGIRALPANASAWDLLKAQVAADFAPFLILLPKPLKRFVVAQSRVLFAQFRTFCEGPVSPMVRAGGKIVGVVGSVLEFVGRDLVKLSRAMSSFGFDAARGDDRPEQPAQAEVVEMEAQEGTPSRSGATSPPLQPPPGSASGLDTGAYDAEEEEVEAVEGEEEGELIEI